MKDTFTDKELKILACFISPKYPKAIRALKSVCKETNLPEEEVLALFEEMGDVYFRPISNTQWAFNNLMFMTNFHKTYPSLFAEYDVHETELGVIFGPKGQKLDLKAIAEKVRDLTKSLAVETPVEVNVKGLVEAIGRLVKQKPQEDDDGTLSFPM